MADLQLDARAITTLRFLTVDAIEQANSGHPGLPLGAAPMAYTLWTRALRHSPAHPAWPNRDRFVLSAGHGSALLYALLYVSGYELPLAEVQQFRQWGSRTPGHPEFGLTPGVEATTGPLGQGLGNAVGLAIAEAHLAARFNRPGNIVIDHHTYALAGDGDMMEGVAAEACSLAGQLGLGKLTVLYDSNAITLAGSTAVSFREDVAARFRAYGWHVQTLGSGDDLDAIEAALAAARAVADQPSVIVVRTIIGEGAPHKRGTIGVHGSPLGAAETRAAKEAAGWPLEPAFCVPDDVAAHMRTLAARGADAVVQWNAAFAAYAAAFPADSAELQRRLAGELPADWHTALPVFAADAAGVATRKASELTIAALAASVPELFGGSADLDPSTLTTLPGAGDFGPPLPADADAQGSVGGGWSYAGRNLHAGVREHGLGAVVNGLAYHGGVIPFGATFLVFSDYMRPTLRLAALSHLGVIWVFTHDSIGVGEDGPTHQPVEHLAALRAIPGVIVLRPGDANETVEAWKVAMAQRRRPVALALTRQAVPTLDRTTFAPASGVARGAYVLNPAGEGAPPPDVLLLATGSELQLAVAAAARLAASGRTAQIVSMPSWELFAEQSAEYRESVLPSAVRARVAVEAGRSMGWERWTGTDGAIVALDHYGASAPAPALFREFGITVDAVVATAEATWQRTR